MGYQAMLWLETRSVGLPLLVFIDRVPEGEEEEQSFIH